MMLSIITALAGNLVTAPAAVLRSRAAKDAEVLAVSDPVAHLPVGLFECPDRAGSLAQRDGSSDGGADSCPVRR